MRNHSQRQRGNWILLAPALFWIIAFAIPLVSLTIRATGVTSELSGLIVSPYYSGVLLFSIKQATLSTIFSVILGLPGAFFIGQHHFPGRKLLRSMSTVPFVLPSILAVLGFVLIFGHSGLLNTLKRMIFGESIAPWKILYSLKAIILAHIFYNFPLTVRIVGDAWNSLPQAEYYAARSLGAGPFRAFMTVDFPRLCPAILTAAVITFLYCFLSFAIILVLGGGPRFSTLEVEIYRLIKFQRDFDKGSSLAIIESTIAVGLLAIYARVDVMLRKRIASNSRTIKIREPGRINGWKLLPAFLYLIPSLFLVLAPLVSIAVYSFFARTTRSSTLLFSLIHWNNLLGGGRIEASTALYSILRTVSLGFTVAGITTLTAALTGWYTVRRNGILVKIIEIMLFLPMGISSVILALGYLVITNRIPGGEMARLAALTAAHSVMALPFAYRIISGRLRTISHRIPQAAQSLGAGSLRAFFTVELPLTRRALVTAAVFSLALSTGELNATLILAPAGFTTMTLAIYRMIGSYNIFDACALGTVLILISFLSFIILDRFGEQKA